MFAGFFHKIFGVGALLKSSPSRKESDGGGGRLTSGTESDEGAKKNCPLKAKMLPYSKIKSKFWCF